MRSFAFVVGLGVVVVLGIWGGRVIYSQDVDVNCGDQLLKDAGTLVLFLFMYLQGTKIVNEIRDKIMKEETVSDINEIRDKNKKEETVSEKLRSIWFAEWTVIQVGIVVMALVFDIVICPTILRSSEESTNANIVLAWAFLAMCVFITVSHSWTLAKEWRILASLGIPNRAITLVRLIK